MEEENKISFWNKIKISIFGLENYQALVVQKISKTLGYLAKLMMILVFLLTIVLTYRFGITLNNVKQYIENNILDAYFEDNTLTIIPKESDSKSIIIEDEDILNGKLIIDTNNLTEEEISNYTDEVKSYTNGIVILKDKIIFKTSSTAVSSTILFSDIAGRYNIVKVDKQDIINILSGSDIWVLYITFFIIMYIYLFIVYFSTILIDALIYSLLGHITGIISRLRLKYSGTYNIAVHALTLPVILNFIYIIVNNITGYTIKYFDIMYMAITCIYIITAILMIKSDVIKKQMELSKIISEQEKVKAEMERKEQEKREEEEKERIGKKDEKQRQQEKDKSKEKNDKEKEEPQPEANIKSTNS